jgi:diphosphomevalonate decarboxylase
MNYHTYGETRFRHAAENVHKILTSLATGNEATFSQIVENEALTLHALLMSSEPGYILLHPNSMQIIKVLKKFRSETGTQFTYTLDAGPNIHLLYPEASRKPMLPFIECELKPLCENNYWIDDKLGNGPEKIK